MKLDFLIHQKKLTWLRSVMHRGWFVSILNTVKILKFGTPQTIAIIVLKIEKFDVTVHQCIQKMLMEWQTA